MKTLLLTLLLSSVSALAQSGQASFPLLELVIPSSPMAREKISKKIIINIDGTVVKKVSQYDANHQPVTKTTNVAFLRSMKDVIACANELRAQTLESDGNPGCMDDAGSRYQVSPFEKPFARKTCGKLEVVQTACGVNMVKALDGLNLLSR